MQGYAYQLPEPTTVTLCFFSCGARVAIVAARGFRVAGKVVVGPDAAYVLSPACAIGNVGAIRVVCSKRTSIERRHTSRVRESSLEPLPADNCGW